MRHMLLLSVLLLGVAWAVAQDSSQASPSTGQTANKAGSGSHTTVEGCLSGSDGKYTLTDKQGTAYTLTGDTSKLAEHVGHEVKITGSTSSASAAAASGAPSGGGMAK